MKKSGHTVLKGVNCVHNDKMKKSGQMVLKGVNWVHNDKMPGQMVLKGVNLATHMHKIRSNGLERSQFSKLGIQYKNQVIWS